jgi:hypothetical protein
MQSVYEAAKARGTHFAAPINQTCNVVAISDEAITLGFVHKPIMEHASKPDARHVISEAIAEVFGKGFEVRFVHEPGVDVWRRRSALVQAAEQMGARVVARNEE